MANDLLTLILDGGIRSPNYFNGRLLSGEDLNLEKAANRDSRRRLGRAIGDGVAFGFEVAETTGVSTVNQPVVTVMPGLAVNRRGQTLMLTTKTDVSLVGSIESEEVSTQDFVGCMPPGSSSYVAGAGIYLLVTCPASGKEGRASVSGLGNQTASCNSRYLIESLQFRLLKMNVSDEDLADSAHLRNRTAYRCLGLTDPGYTSFITDPFGQHDTGYGLLDDLRPDVLTDCDVPLALLYWTSTGGIKFIDLWGVRRRITLPSADDGWLSVASARRVSEGEAMFLQFQDQITAMVQTASDPTALQASAYFDFLPPVGILPLDAGAKGKGVDPNIFFGGQTVRGIFSTTGTNVPSKGQSVRDGLYIEGARLSELVRDAIQYPPIDLSTKLLIWLYVVRENMQSVDNKTVAFPRPFAVFVSGYLHYCADARFDVNRWNYSNYSLAKREL